ncbi:hypothetical protein QFZ77_007538 [Paenibacillus sp. V4I3]|uniref:hypothetical protein n=1 Tax=Paenibacillus sp. V4I3 TaxID=3042305 RepID=UPI0027833675|nr:hypothetical protein [Paenibacillus sp. V4I3]MDQ0878879.1 hypothetical protein [Paenibacillus sp. V4I3]
MRRFFIMFLLTMMILSGCSASKDITMPMINDIDSVQYVIPLESIQIPPLNPAEKRDKEIIEKILVWLSKSKVLGYKESFPSKSIPPNYLSVKLTNGKFIKISPAIHGKEIVEVTTTPEVFRVLAPELNDWIHMGWKQDLISQKQ